MKKKLLFIINPISGKGNASRIAELIERNIDKQKFDYYIAYTKHAGHAIELSNEARKKNIDVVCAVGGDGSVNEVAQGIVNSHISMAIIPIGSGNGMARHLKIPLDIVEAIRSINTGKILKADTATVNDRLCVGTIGIGFDAHVGWLFAQYGKRGVSSYVKIILKELLSYKCKNYVVESEEHNYSGKAFLITIANSSQYGNDAFIAPAASVSDGLLNVVILKKFSFFAVPLLVYQLLKKQINNSKYVTSFTTRSVKITQDQETAHIDGEPFLAGKNITVKVNPLYLNLLVPING